MFTESTGFRPRNGQCALAYWRVRLWCEENGFSFSDVLNPILVPLSYYLQNSCIVDREKNMATVELNIGKLPLLHCFGGKQYPLLSQKNDAAKPAFSIDQIQKRIEYWEERIETHPEQCDITLAELAE